MSEEKLKTGLSKTTAAALSYVLGPVSGVVFLILEKDKFVRFHAMQSVVVLGILILLQQILTITVFFIPLANLVWILWFVLWLVMIYKSWQGEEWEVPILGKYARRLVKKV